ncbi:MAG: DUF711 family protein [Planctomycetota bacterium]
MKIRSVTVFNGHPDARTSTEILRSGRAAQAIRKRLVDAGFDVQMIRLALAPAPEMSRDPLREAQTIELLAHDAGLNFISLGPIAQTQLRVHEIDRLSEIIAGTSAIFLTAPISHNGVANPWAMRPIANAIKAIAAATENGFGNLRFAALAECPPGIPFFPAAYARPNDFSFALALECADLALDATTQSTSPNDAMATLSRVIEDYSKRMEIALHGIEAECGARFDGFDWSLAPHPDKACSIGAAIEALSGAPFGTWGTLSAVAALTRAIRNANVRHVGFSGVFLALLEDYIFARRTRSIADMQSLLLYSAVCGSGLDTIPLAGDADPASIAALMGDVATLSTTLKKPLTARLMPVPGLKAGELTRFDFPFLVNGYTLAV